MQIVLIQYYLSINPNQCELWVMKPLSPQKYNEYNSKTLQIRYLRGFVHLVHKPTETVHRIPRHSERNSRSSPILSDISASFILRISAASRIESTSSPIVRI